MLCVLFLILGCSGGIFDLFWFCVK